MALFDPHDILAAWSARFAQRDSAGLAAIYREDALLYGSGDSLLVGRKAIEGYFAALPAEGAASARFDDVTRLDLSATTAAIAATVHFAIGVVTLSMRITLTFVERNGIWQIGVHHASMPMSPETLSR